MTTSNLIPHSHADRLARRDDKRRKLLAWLRSEIWTTPRIAADVMGLDLVSSAGRPLAAMARDGLVAVDEVTHPNNTKLQLVGITLDGQAHIAGLLDKPFIARAYERGRVGLLTMSHRSDLQALRLACARAGWREWRYPDRVPAAAKTSKDTHRPDAIALHPSGMRIAIEVERTIKTAKRYRFIAGRHLDAMARDDYQRVVYAAPDAARATALQTIWQSLGHVVVAGRDVTVTDDLFVDWRFCTYSQVPTLEI
jgi:hypothetical protein